MKKPQIESRVRIPEGQVVSSMSPLDLLGQYFASAKVEDAEALQKLAQEIISEKIDKRNIAKHPFGTQYEARKLSIVNLKS